MGSSSLQNETARRGGRAAGEATAEFEKQSTEATVTPLVRPDPGAISAFLAFFAKLLAPARAALVTICLLDRTKMEGFTLDVLREAERNKAAEIIARRNAGGAQIYFAVNAPKERINKKPSKDETEPARFAHVEVDPDAFMKAKGGYDAARAYLHDEVVAAMKASPTPPTIIWSSGNGISALWALKEPLEHDKVELLNRRLAKKYGGDPGTHNVDRVLRLAGTANHSTKKKVAKGYPNVARLATVLHQDPEARYTADHLAGGLPEVDPAEAAVESEPGAASGRFDEDTSPLDEGERLALMERLEAERAADVILDARLKGSTAGLEDPSRSGLDASLGVMLKARGFSYREMRLVLIAYAHGAGAAKAKAKDGDERYFQRIWSRLGWNGVSVEETKQHLDELYLDARISRLPLATEAWAKVLFDAHLDDVGREEVLRYLVEELKVGRKHGVKAAFKDYFATRSESFKAKRSKDRLTIVAKDRAPVLFDPLNWNGMLPEIESAMVDLGLMRIDRAFVYVAEDVLPGSSHPDNDKLPENEKLPPPKQTLFVPHTRASMGLGIEKAVCLYRRGEKGTVIPMEVPWDRMPGLMLELPEKRAPRVNGLVLHPVHTPGGRLISTEGLDRETGLFLAFIDWKFPEVKAAPTKDEAVAKAQLIRELLFSEVMFKDPTVDGAAAVAALMTGVSRKSMSQGPAVLINATVQGTGKTTLARMIHVVLTGRDMSVQTLPADEGEARKQFHTLLMRSPAMVNFDNIPDGATIDNPVLSPLITSSSYTQRILGMSQDVTVPTSTLFVFTGNNIGVGSDLIRRFVKVDLLAKEACPEQRRFKNPDPVAYTQAVRAEVIHALLTIQRAWFAAGAKEEGPSLGLGSDVDRLVTWPLAFAGEEGIFQKRDELAESSPEQKAKVSALVALAEVFPGGVEFTSNDAVRKMGGGSEFPPTDPNEAALRDAIEETDRRRVHSAPVLGLFLRTLVDQPLKNLSLVLRSRIVTGSTRYRVEATKPSR